MFFFNDTATTEIYTLSLHDALPIWRLEQLEAGDRPQQLARLRAHALRVGEVARVVVGDLHPERPPLRARLHLRSEEHTSELQSRQYLVCRLLLEKKKQRKPQSFITT